MSFKLKNLFNIKKNEQISVVILVVVSVIVVCWIIFPMMQHKTIDSFDSGVTTKKNDNVDDLSDYEKELPYVHPPSATILDGPGYEKYDIEGAYQASATAIPSNYYFLDDGANGELSIQHNLCSKSCCSEQWPTPFKQKYDPYVCANKDKFVPTNITCNNSFQDSGCLCLTKSQAQSLYNRAGNGPSWF